MASQPILGETGSLAANGLGSPAVGKVAAKVGTSVSVDPVTGRLYSKVQALAGYLTLDDGTELVFGLYMSGGSYAELVRGAGRGRRGPGPGRRRLPAEPVGVNDARRGG